MSKRNDTLSTLALALQILHRLDPVLPSTAPALAESLGEAFPRDLRTYQRLLRMLADQGFATCDASVRPANYWRSAKGRGLVEPLTPEEAIGLDFVRAHLDPVLPPHAARGLNGLLDKARVALTPQSTLSPSAKIRLGTRADPVRERAWVSKVGVAPTSMPLLPPSIDPEVSRAVSEALYEDRWLTLDYRGANGTTQRELTVMPLALMQQGPRRYLIACRGVGAQERQYALHRILAARAEPTALPEQRPPFSVKEYIDSGRAGFGTGEKVAVVFHIEQDSGNHLRETPVSLDQRISIDREGWMRVSATVPDSIWFWDWLRGFGHRAYLVEPAERAESYWDEGLAGLRIPVLVNGKSSIGNTDSSVCEQLFRR